MMENAAKICFTNLQITFVFTKTSLAYCRFQVTFQRAGPEFVANLPTTFPSSKIGRELRNKVRKYISMFEQYIVNKCS
jgi:hypothetical protein